MHRALSAPALAAATTLLCISASASEPAPSAAPGAAALSERDGVQNDGYRVSLSLPTEDDRAAWRSSGLRVDLGVQGALLAGVGPAPRIGAVAFQVRPRLRLDPSWSLGLALGYALARGSYTGARWTAVLEPTYHPTPSFGVSLALGYGGLDVSSTRLAPPAPGSSTETTSRTMGRTEEMFACAGAAWVAQARLEYLWVVGPLLSTGPYLVVDSQWTGCQESFGTTDRETGKPTLGQQWWLHLGAGIGWWFSWR